MRPARRDALQPAGLQTPASVPAPHVTVVPETGPASTVPSVDELNAWVLAVGERGDRLAFAALFRHFAPRLKGFLMRAGVAEALAEDLAQETLAVVWRRASTYDPERAQLSTWLFTIARNLRVDHHRRQAGGAPAAEDAADDLADDQQLPPEELAQRAQLQRQVRAALRRLPPEQAQVLQLSFFHEEPHTRIAERLGVPLGTVKSRIRLAVDQLRRHLDGFAP